MATTSPFTRTAAETADLINRGQMDEHLDTLAQAIQYRRDVLIADKRDDLTVGATVYFNSKANPQYLCGAEAKVVRFKTKKVVVQLVRPVGRFQGYITTPVSIIQTQKP